MPRLPGWSLLVLVASCLVFPAGADFARTWAPLPVSGESPGLIAEQSGVFDEARGRLVVFGGFVLEALDETHALDVATGGWTRLDPPVSPPARFNATTIHDRARGRMIVLGGANTALEILDDAWAFDLATDTWSPFIPAGLPPLFRAAAAVDRSGDRAILFGGANNDIFLDSTWSLDLATGQLSLLDTMDAPPSRFGAVMAGDGPRGRVVLFGGNRRETYFDDTWELDLTTLEWAQIPTLLSPDERAFMSSAVDRDLERWLLVGGNFGGRIFDDTWAFDFVTDVWTRLSIQRPPTRRNNAVLVFDSTSRLAYLHGGNNAGALFGDVWVFTDPSFDTASGLLRFNGRAGAVDQEFINGGPLILEIQGRTASTPYLLFADVGDRGSNTRLARGVPFCFDPDPSSSGFTAGTRLVCDTVGVSGPGGPLAALGPPRLATCPRAPALPSFVSIVNEVRVNLRPGLVFVLQALVRDPLRPEGFGSTPCVRVTVIE